MCWKINDMGGFMKFLKINAKVLLILCLFSGILFLSTGCGENTDNNSGTDNGSDVGMTKQVKAFAPVTFNVTIQ